MGGEVDIDASPVPGNPQATLQKAQTVERAALAPAEPSPQDRRVAAQAARLEARARQQLAHQRREAASGEGEAAPGARADFLAHYQSSGSPQVGQLVDLVA